MSEKKIKFFERLIVSFSVFIAICFFGIVNEFNNFLDVNESYIITIDNEVIYCQSIDFKKSYITLQIDDNTFRNIPISYPIQIESVYEIENPGFIEYLRGDYGGKLF